MADEENKSQQPEEEAKQVTPAVPPAEETPATKAKATRDEAKNRLSRKPRPIMMIQILSRKRTPVWLRLLQRNC